MIRVFYNFKEDSEDEFMSEVFMTDSNEFVLIEDLNMICIKDTVSHKTSYIPVDLIFKIEVI